MLLAHLNVQVITNTVLYCEDDEGALINVSQMMTLLMLKYSESWAHLTGSQILICTMSQLSV